ncbi:MAG: hypothetical protein WCW14_02540 [Candidatus Paceibacterota bacterium]|jgi:hypothetical protein
MDIFGFFHKREQVGQGQPDSHSGDCSMFVNPPPEDDLVFGMEPFIVPTGVVETEQG